MLNESEHELVRAAIENAEKEVHADIVPCVLAQSSPYPETIWAGSLFGSGIVCGIFLYLDYMQPLWLPLSIMFLCVALAGVMGGIFGMFFAPFKRLITGTHRMEQSVARRAKEIFYDRGLSATKSRRVILIFVSLLERRVMILCDEGLRKKIRPTDWLTAVDTLAEAAAEKRLAQGFVAAIEQVCVVLRVSGLKAVGGGEIANDIIEEDSK